MSKPCIWAKKAKGCGCGGRKYSCSIPEKSGKTKDIAAPTCITSCNYRVNPDGLKKGLSISAVVPCFNEDPERLHLTVHTMQDSLLDGTDLEIILLDDGSDKPIEMDVDGVKVIRNEPGIGAMQSINKGIEIAEGEVVTSWDSHMRIIAPGTFEVMASRALEEPCIPTLPSRGYGEDAGGQLRGCFLYWNVKDGLQCRWRNLPKSKKEWIRVPAMMGADYAYSRETIDLLSQHTGNFWDNIVGRWGFGEQSMAVKAFLQDVPIYLCNHHPVGHFYRSENPLGSKGENVSQQVWENITYSMALCLHEDTFRRRFFPYCNRHLPEEHIEELVELANNTKTNPTNVVASTGGSKYHLPDCSYAPNGNSESRWALNSQREAEFEGFEPCSVCKPKSVVNHMASREKERKIFTHLCGYKAKITEPHRDNKWLDGLEEELDGMDTDSIENILVWRPNEALWVVRDKFPYADINCYEVRGPRFSNWNPILKETDINLHRADWSAFEKLPEKNAPYDLILVCGDKRGDCLEAAKEYITENGRIIESPTAHRFQLEHGQRKDESAKVVSNTGEDSDWSEAPQNAPEIDDGEGGGNGGSGVRKTNTDYMRVLAETTQKVKPSKSLIWGNHTPAQIINKLHPDSDVTIVSYREREYNQAEKTCGDWASVIHEPIPDYGSSNYAYWPLKTKAGPFDLIMVDGRRRVECLLVAREVLSEDGVVLIHDAERPSYEPGIGLYKQMREVDNGRTRILKLK